MALHGDDRGTGLRRLAAVLTVPALSANRSPWKVRSVPAHNSLWGDADPAVFPDVFPVAAQERFQVAHNPLGRLPGLGALDDVLEVVRCFDGQGEVHGTSPALDKGLQLVFPLRHVVSSWENGRGRGSP